MITSPASSAESSSPVALPQWPALRVLLTGAGGFIGSHLAERLVRAGARVRAFVHYNSRNDRGLLEYVDDDVQAALEIVLGDLTDATMVRRVVADCQIVFHLGALIAIPYSYQAPRHFIDTNVIGTLNVLQACLEEGVLKVVHTSTSETYGSARYTPMDEQHPLQAQSPYAASKIAADKLAESFYCSFNLPVATIRPFNTFGPRQSARAVIPTIMSQALAGDTIRLGALTPGGGLSESGRGARHGWTGGQHWDWARCHHWRSGERGAQYVQRAETCDSRPRTLPPRQERSPGTRVQ